MRAQALGSREAGATTTSGIEEGFANILAVQSLGSEAHQRQRFARESWASFGAFRRLVFTPDPRDRLRERCPPSR